ncbi:MAG TPA: NAD-binding protein [Oscillospiraceae bacterium]|nr:NAD-binding protein [Oscillospiraceae bacterium]
MKVTVVGGGKVGYYLIKTLIEHHHEPTVIEADKKTSAFLANELDIPVICGDGTQIETLSSARVGESQAIVCVTGMDECNLIACQLAKKIFNVPKIIAKVNNPKNADALKQLGVDNVINSTNNIASLIEHEVDASRIKQLITIHHGAGSICELELPKDYDMDGVLIKNLKLPETINIISITRNDTLIIPRGQTPLKSGDKLLILTHNTLPNQIYSALKLDNRD